MIGFDYRHLWEWEEFDPSRLLEVMGDFDAPWWVAGGWALDLWMERHTRPHQDVDVAILRGDQQKLYTSLSQWELYYAAPDHRLLPLGPIRGFNPRFMGYGRGGHTTPHGCASSSSTSMIVRTGCIGRTQPCACRSPTRDHNLRQHADLGTGDRLAVQGPRANGER
jgi:hypothetical protein